MRMRLSRLAAMALAAVVVLAASALGAQETRVLTGGVPVQATLDATRVTQVFTYSAATAETVRLSTANTTGVPLVIVVNDASGAQLAALADLDSDGQLVLDGVALPAPGGYLVTVLQAGSVISGAAVDFTLLLEASAPAEVAPTQAPVAEATPVASGLPDQVVTTSGLQVALTWASTADLDIEVRDPVGGSLYWRTPTVDSGGTLGANANQGCAVASNPATETASWSPGGVPTGSYEVLVYFQQSCNNNAPASFSITPTMDGVALAPVQGTLSPGGIFVAGFTVNVDGTAAFNNSGGEVQSGVLTIPTADIDAVAAQPIAVGETLTGAIRNSQPFSVFSFTAEADQLYTIGVDATSGSLDTYLAVIDAQGRLVRENDDSAQGITNSLISSMLAPAAGEYRIVVSRYAKQIGATEGEYQVTLSASGLDLPADFSANIVPGSLQMILLWDTDADLQLLVRDPAGDAVFDDVPNIRSGGTLAASGNVNCRQVEGAPYSYVYWPQDVPPRPGSYEVEVWYQNACNDTRATTANLFILYNGQTIYSETFSPLPNERFLTSFDINAEDVAVPGPGGIIRGVDDLNYQSDLASALPIVRGVPVTGSITPDNKFDLYTFDGAAGDVINVALNNTSGTLDPLLFLIGPSGVSIATNDDAVAGENTNSLIANLTLPADGQYIIIATHFGGLYGGTTGAYQLTLTQLN